MKKNCSRSNIGGETHHDIIIIEFHLLLWSDLNNGKQIFMKSDRCRNGKIYGAKYKIMRGEKKYDFFKYVQLYFNVRIYRQNYKISFFNIYYSLSKISIDSITWGLFSKGFKFKLQ